MPDSKDRELALQGLYFMVNAGAACGPVLGLWAGLSGNPHGFFITAASYGALGLGLLWLHRPGQLAQSKAATAQPHSLNFITMLRLLRQDQLFAVIILANILINFIYAHADSSLIQYLTRADFPQLVTLISSLVMVNSLIIVSCQFPLLRLLGHWPVIKRIYLGVVLLGLSQVWFAFNPVDWFWGWLGAMAVLSIGEAVLFANMNVHLDQLAPPALPALRGSYFGAASLYAIGYSLSPLLGGLILDVWGGPALFAISAGLCALVLGCYATAPRLRRPDFSALKLPG